MQEIYTDLIRAIVYEKTVQAMIKYIRIDIF